MKVLIADDEPLARLQLRRQLEAQPGVDLIVECANGLAAAALIAKDPPDLVFLDIRMPGLDGFGVIERVGAARMPPVVFVTAHDDHAIDAFEVGALDYLLKPFDADRFHDAFSRAARRMALERGPAISDRLVSLLATLGQSETRSSPAAERIPVNEGGRVCFVEPAAVEWAEAAGNYVRLHAGPRNHLLRHTLEAMHVRLGPRFLRVRRTALVNRDAVESAEPYGKGSWVLALRGGGRIVTSRHYRPHLAPLFGEPR
ncbi:MAG: LytTR family DNA-binding domain-containing protein [Gemmatimonadota bacterium]